MDNQVVTIILTIIGGGIGYFIKYIIDKKKELQNEVNKERRESYQGFVNLIIDILSPDNNKKPNHIKELKDFSKKNILYASPTVVSYFSDYMQFVYSTSEQKMTPEQNATHFLLLTKVLKEMRKDIGLSNKGLGNNGEVLVRAILKDFDKTILLRIEENS